MYDLIRRTPGTTKTHTIKKTNTVPLVSQDKTSVAKINRTQTLDHPAPYQRMVGRHIKDASAPGTVRMTKTSTIRKK